MKINTLEIILKTVERCNINCSYCYFFNGVDNSYLKHPKYISLETIKNLGLFLQKGCSNNDVKEIIIDFHGGEPMIQKKSEFDTTCSIITEMLKGRAKLEFNIQTNAMLVDEGWIELFHKYNVNVGVSIDGPKEINDSQRIDHKGKGTYDRVVKGISKLQEAVTKNRIKPISALCVINPKYSAKEIYRHFVDTLQIYNMDFLLPDFNYDTMQEHTQKTGFTADDYGKYLQCVFDEWTTDDNPQITIRILNSTMSLLLGNTSYLLGFGPADSSSIAFTVASNGDIAPDDTLRSSDTNLMVTNNNVRSATLDDYLKDPTFSSINSAASSLATPCRSCLWETICQGGALVNRYSASNGFDNPSVMCSGLKYLYSHVLNFLINHGYPAEKIYKTLIPNGSALTDVA